MERKGNLVIINDIVCGFIFYEDDTFLMTIVGGGEVLFTRSHTKVISFPTILNENYTHNEMKYKLKNLDSFMSILKAIFNEFGCNFFNVQAMKNKYGNAEKMSHFEL